jgi:hypothetical protein
MTAFFVILNMPSFFSNLFIDGDRLNWKQAAEFLQDYNAKCSSELTLEVYTNGPGYLRYYLRTTNTKIKIENLSKLNFQEKSQRNNNKLVIIPLRRGGLDFEGGSSDIQRKIFTNTKLYEIIGRDRLDIKINKFAIFTSNNDGCQ